MGGVSVEAKFAKALELLVAQVRNDHSILAAILCGSLSHDRVWERSDIDLALVTIDDKKIESSDLSLNVNGVNVHALMMPRADFRRIVEGAARNSFFHSFLAKGTLLYTHDETIARLCARLGDIGDRDTQMQLMSAGTHAIYCIDKAHKFLTTRGDLDYTGLWILNAATPLARIEVLAAKQLAGREVIQQAMALNPGFFDLIYTRMLNTKKTRKSIDEAISAIDHYFDSRLETLFRPVLEYLKEVGEVRSASEIQAHFKRNHNVDGVTMACEYLAGKGLLTKVSQPVQLTKRSNIQVEELAFVYTENHGNKGNDEDEGDDY